MKTVALTEAVKELYNRTRILYLPYENPEKVRSHIGDVLHRAGQVPGWWYTSRANVGAPRVPSPFRVTPDLDARLVRVQWLDVVDEDMVPLVRLMFRGTSVERLTPNLTDAGNIFTVQYLSTMYYTVRAMQYRKYHGYQDRHAPNLGHLVQYTRTRNRVLLSHWLNLSVDNANQTWFSGDTFTLLDAQGQGVTRKHRSHRTGFEFHATGFVGQALYTSTDRNACQEAHAWLQIASLWGAASGTTWGWSSLWATSFTADPALREPGVITK